MRLGSPLSPWSQLRRCHRCNHVNETRGQRVANCSQCSAKFAPFYFADTTPDALRTRRASARKPSNLQYQPLMGIAAWWNEQQEPGQGQAAG